MDTKLLKKYFGEKFLKKKSRFQSYDFVENFLSNNFKEYEKDKNTNTITDKYLIKLSKFSQEELAFLILHSGYIPDHYKDDSSEETLHSKLTETLIFHWAKQIGFDKSELPTQKSSYEDITISDNKNIIVCDAKSFRLGRSQSAPNVKDTIKLADYEKWLVKHGKKGIGGLITFPSLHNWTRGGDVYRYVSDPKRKVLLLFYEHISFFLKYDYKSKNLVDLIKKYSELFKKQSKDKDTYWVKITENLFANNLSDFKDFNKLANSINQENVKYKKKSLEKKIQDLGKKISLLFKDYVHIDKLKEEISNHDSQTYKEMFVIMNKIHKYQERIKFIKMYRIK